MAIYDVNAIREDIAELNDEASALVQLAEDEKREFSAEENERFNAITEVEKPEKERQLQTAEKMAALRAEQARNRLPQNPGGGPGSELVEAESKPKIQFSTPKARLKVFKGPEAQQQAYVFGQYVLCHCSGDRVERQRAANWLSEHGYKNAVTTTEAVPTEVIAQMIEYRETVGATRQLCEVVNMNSEFLEYPKMTAGQTVYYPGKAVAITESDPTFTSVDLTAVKRATLTLVANETQADSVVNMADRVASRAAFQLALREDVEFVTGDGSAGFGGVTGLETAVTTNEVTIGTPAFKPIYVGGFMSGCLLGSRDSISLAQSTEHAFDQDALAIRATSRYDMVTHEEAAIAVINADLAANITMAHLSAAKALIADKYKAGGVSWFMSGQTFAGVIEPLFYAQGGNTTRLTEQGVMPAIFGDRVVFSDAVPSAP